MRRAPPPIPTRPETIPMATPSSEACRGVPNGESSSASVQRGATRRARWSGSAMADQANFSSTRWRPASPSCFALAGSARSSVMGAARSRANWSGSTGKVVSGSASNGTRWPVSPSTDDLENAAGGGGDDGGPAGHGFEVDDAEGLVHRGAAEDGAVGVELDGLRLGDHLLDPDDVVAGAGGVPGGDGVAASVG